MPRIIQITKRGLDKYLVVLSCGHVRPIETAAWRAELPAKGQAWPCPRCTPKEDTLYEDRPTRGRGRKRGELRDPSERVSRRPHHIADALSAVRSEIERTKAHAVHERGVSEQEPS